MTQHNHLEHWLAQERDILATLDAGPGRAWPAESRSPT